MARWKKGGGIDGREKSVVNEREVALKGSEKNFYPRVLPLEIPSVLQSPPLPPLSLGFSLCNDKDTSPLTRRFAELIARRVNWSNREKSRRP